MPSGIASAVAPRSKEAGALGLARGVTGLHYGTGSPVTLYGREGRIREVRPARETRSLPWIAPGLVDLMLGGYQGVNLNGREASVDKVVHVMRALGREGITTVFPTIGTNSDELIERGVRRIAEACERDAVSRSMIAGIHLEGPFISPEDGPRGAHERRLVKAPDWALLQRWQRAARGKIRILTMSPEWPGAGRFIRQCTESGVTVAIGHTAATPEQVRDAVAAGARLSTHLGNGSHLTLPRHPNYVWEQLAADDLWASVIADGFHLPDSVLKVIFRVKGPRALLVSDAGNLAGMPPGPYRSSAGTKIVLSPDGRLSLAENPKLLAGSVQMLRGAVHHLASRNLSTLGEAWDRASTRPSRLMGLPAGGGLEPGAPADVVLFERGASGIRIVRAFKGGRSIYSADGG